MADIFSKEKRSEIMSKILSKNTVAERIVFKYLRENKIYFQKHYTKVIGKPDVALPRKKKAVFIDSDFWHGYNFEKEKKTLPEFWKIKIEKNIEKDKTVNSELDKKGWEVLRVREIEIKTKRTQEEVLQKIKDFLLKSKT